jgi:TolB-like protein
MVCDHYEFGAYHLDAQSRMLFRDGDRVALPPKVIELLVTLIEAAGSVLTREQLLQRLWPDTIVEEGSLTSHISLLRKALGERQTQPVIETIPRRGYRFVGQLKSVGRLNNQARPAPMMLVVLPFENLTEGEDKHDYFSDGLTEEMITQLARLSPDQLGVIARTSSMHYKGTTKTARKIGEELGVSHLMEGSVRRVGTRARITAQLIRVSDECHVWAQSYERSLNDVLALQADVARAIAREVQIKLTPHEQTRLDLQDSLSVDSQAHELYLMVAMPGTSAPKLACAIALSSSKKRFATIPRTHRHTMVFPMPIRCWRAEASSLRRMRFTRPRRRRATP